MDETEKYCPGEIMPLIIPEFKREAIYGKFQKCRDEEELVSTLGNWSEKNFQGMFSCSRDDIIEDSLTIDSLLEIKEKLRSIIKQAACINTKDLLPIVREHEPNMIGIDGEGNEIILKNPIEIHGVSFTHSDHQPEGQVFLLPLPDFELVPIRGLYESHEIKWRR